MEYVQKNKQTINLFLKIAIVIVLYIKFKGFINGILIHFGLAKSPEDKAFADMKSEGAVDVVKKAEASIVDQEKKYPPTKPYELLLQNAINIHGLMSDVLWTDNEQEAYELMVQVNNSTDVLLLIKAFGIRTQYMFYFVPIWSGDLSYWVRRKFSEKAKYSINEYYRRKKIKYNF